LDELIDRAQRALAGTGPTEVVFNAAPHARHGIPAGGAGPADPVDGAGVTARADGYHLSNEHLDVVVDARGLIVSVVDRATGREAIAPGTAAGLLQLHADLPNRWDAWDVDQFYRNTVTDIDGVTTIEAQASAVRVERRFGSSHVVQTITLAPGA